ncbi:MAG: hypothetical protein A4E39_00360 [Methanoregulaceae archaeon PtaB.Bin152]|nr:MAG: hypothetical protein A4E39_00360 [Methanoregulaceae archaeon PtaB.Bin152]
MLKRRTEYEVYALNHAEFWIKITFGYLERLLIGHGIAIFTPYRLPRAYTARISCQNEI